MAKFGGVSGSGNVKGMDPMLYDTGDRTVREGRQSSGAFGNFAEGEPIGDGFGSYKEPLSQEDVALVKDFTKKFSRVKSKDEFDSIIRSDDYTFLIYSIGSDNVKLTPDQEKLVNNLYKTINTKNIAFLEAAASKNYTDFSGDVTYNLEDTTGSILLQLNEKIMTQQERNVLNAMKTVFVEGKSFDDAIKTLTTDAEKEAFMKAYERSDRDVLKTRSKYGDADDTFSKHIRDKNPSEKEMIYWVKAAYNDFGYEKNGSSTVMSRLIDIAVSEELYGEGASTITKQAVDDAEIIYMQAHSARMNPTELLKISQRHNSVDEFPSEDTSSDKPSLTDVFRKVRAHEPLSPAEENVWKEYNYSKHHDRDGGADSSYSNTMATMALELTGFDPRKYDQKQPKNKRTITRKLD